MILPLLLLVSTVGALSPYEYALSSPTSLVQLYSSFRDQLGTDRPSSSHEQRLRLGLFKSSLKFVLEQNKIQEWRSGLNMFSDMTAEEAKAYEGVNMTEVADTQQASGSSQQDYSFPEESMWLDSVFQPMDQGNCGSCWIFGSLTAYEGRYHQLTGKLKKFSQQQMLDCVFAWRGDGGCAGGANYCTYSYIKKGNPLVRAVDYPAYAAKESACRDDRYQDGQKAGKLSGWVLTHPTEEGLLVALSHGVTAVSFETTPAFRAYESGVIRDETCAGQMTTHAVAAVGYTPAYILIKNSWGTNWGEGGFVKFGRNHHGCLLHTKPIYPVLETTGQRDSDPSETATSYNPGKEEARPRPGCADNYPSWYCNRSRCRSWEAAVDCEKTCERCSFDRDTCPGGETMCADATCRDVC